MLAEITKIEDGVGRSSSPPIIKKQAKKSRLFHIRMDVETENQIEDLKEMIHPSTKTEVFKNAIQLLDYIAHEYKQGSKFLIQKEGSEETEEVVIFAD